MSKDKDTYIDNPDISTVKRIAEKKRQDVEIQNDDEKHSRFAAFFKDGRTRFVAGTILIIVCVYLLITFLSFFFSAGAVDQNRVTSYTLIENAQNKAVKNAGAAVGASLSNFLIADGVGVAAFIIVIWAFTIGFRLVRGKKTFFFNYTLISIYSIFACSLIVGAASYFMPPITFFPLGGAFGYQATYWLLGLVGLYGMIGVNAIVLITWIALCINRLRSIYKAIHGKMPKLRNYRGEIIQGSGEENDIALSDFKGSKHSNAEQQSHKQDTKPTVAAAPAQAVPADNGNSTTAGNGENMRRKIQRNPANLNSGEPATMKKIEQANTFTNPNDPTGEYIHYRFPGLNLLKDTKMRYSVDREEQESNKKRIAETLRNYGIEIKTIEAHVGPTVTLFEIVPQDGVRISRIRGLEDDIALSLSALGIRIIAPMPGRGTIGIEVPNHDPQVVPMRVVLESKKFQETKAALPMALGCTVSNEVFVADLAKMPHLLVAGATGQGKSVGLNCIITSLLYKKGPSELKFVLVDPKKVEFSLYADLEKYYFACVPGLDSSIVTEPKDVVVALNSLVQEMEDRYRVLEKAKTRKIEDYNRKWKERLRNELDENGRPFRYMPYIVVIVDEFSDLIMQSGKEVETPIVRIAQKARAVGIHMIIATQRPSTNVITGLIKANFPGRMAFRVTQMVDSRTIIDRPGAERLIGRGDMLFSAGGEITRLQCPFIDTPEVEQICEFIKEQEDNDKFVEHERPFMLPEYLGSAQDEEGGGFAGSSAGDKDSLFDESARWVVASGDTASTSALQRRYSIGYNRAGRIMDQMEAAGIVGPAQGGKPRKVLMDMVTLESILGSK